MAYFEYSINSSAKFRLSQIIRDLVLQAVLKGFSGFLSFYRTLFDVSELIQSDTL